MTPGLLDHLLLVSLAVVFPIEGFFARRRLERAIAKNGRVRQYLMAMAWQWTFAAAAIAIWSFAHRPWSALGATTTLRFGFWPALGACLGLTHVLLRQARAAQARPEFAAHVRAAGKSLEFLLPSTPVELRAFNMLAITAGVVEELLYRGFLIWYFAAYLPLALAVLASSIVFGLGHAYQGARGVMKTGLVGLALAGLFVLAGGLWIPMFMHAAVDILQARMLYNARAHPVDPDAQSGPLSEPVIGSFP